MYSKKIIFGILIFVLIIAFFVFNSGDKKLKAIKEEKDKYVKKNIEITKKQVFKTKFIPKYTGDAIARTASVPGVFPECPYDITESEKARYYEAIKADKNLDIKRADILYRSGQYYEAFLLLKRVISENSDNPFIRLRAYSSLVKVLYKLNKPKEYQDAWYNLFYFSSVIAGNNEDKAKEEAKAFIEAFNESKKLRDPEVLKKMTEKGIKDKKILAILRLLP